MYLSVIKIYPLPGRKKAVIDALVRMKYPNENDIGCLGCSVSVEPGRVGAVCYTEQWSTRDDLDRHLRSLLYYRVLESMECSHRQPEIDFYEMTRIGGLEVVEQIRIPNPSVGFELTSTTPKEI